jgi:two-component system osmolarity sensor histidine kinase EnvZ
LEQKNNNLLKQNTIEEKYLNLSYSFYQGSHLPPKQPKISEELGIFKNIINVKINKKNIIKINDAGRIEVILQLPEGLMKITFPSKLLMNPTAYIFVLWLIFLTILLLSISLIFSKNQIKSILTLAEVADQFGRGIKTTQKFKPSGAKEIKKAGIAFLNMQERLEKQISKRTKMLAMISHDLFTPLTRMKLQIELMEKSEETDGLKEDIITMQQMIKSYLDFAKGENGEEAEIIDLSSWIPIVLNKWSNYDIEIINIESVKALIKPSSFERAISNIISNAVKYSTKIKISVYSTTTNIIMKIEDNGVGIKDEEKLLVFKAFYRSDKSRSLNNFGNVGLGLAITKEIIIDHNGTISLQDSKILGGLLVRISLPIFQE